MLFQSRKAIAFTTLISGLLLFPLARAGAQTVKKSDISEIDMDSLDEQPSPTPTASKPAPVKAKAAAKTPTPVPVKTNTPVPVRTNTPLPTKTPTPGPKVKITPTPVATKAEIKTPVPTPEPTGPDLFGPQFSLSLDAFGQGLFRPKQANPDFGFGGQVFGDWRPIQYLSLGIGGEYNYFPGTKSFSLGTFDVAGRIFPLTVVHDPIGEFYLQGGLGFNLSKQAPEAGNYHGYAGVGYRVYLSTDMALDTGAQYDLYSPLGAATHGVAAKVGLTFLFGRTRWPEPSDNGEAMETEGVSHGNYHRGSPTYVWKAGDSLKGVSEKVFGDPLLYSRLVDANKELFLHPVQMRTGVEIRVPQQSLTDDEVEAFHDKSLRVSFYTKMEKTSDHMGYQADPNWKGPTRYTWRRGDTFGSVAEKIYGDDDLYPILVDANAKRLILPANLKPGTVLVIPAPPAGEWVDIIRSWARNKDPYTWWRVSSENANGDEGNGDKP